MGWLYMKRVLWSAHVELNENGSVINYILGGILNEMEVWESSWVKTKNLSSGVKPPALGAWRPLNIVLSHTEL